MTSHITRHITSHDIALHDMRSRNQPYYPSSSHRTTKHMTSYRIIPHHITSHHITAHHITSPPTHHKNTTTRQTAEAWCTKKNSVGAATGWWPSAHSIGKFFLWRIFLPETSAPARGLLVCTYLNLYLAQITIPKKNKINSAFKKKQIL